MRRGRDGAVDVADGDTCLCDSCGDEFTVADVRNLIASWGPLLAWLDAHPARKAVG